MLLVIDYVVFTGSCMFLTSAMCRGKSTASLCSKPLPWPGLDLERTPSQCAQLRPGVGAGCSVDGQQRPVWLKQDLGKPPRERPCSVSAAPQSQAVRSLNPAFHAPSPAVSSPLVDGQPGPSAVPTWFCAAQAVNWAVGPAKRDGVRDEGVRREMGTATEEGVQRGAVL